MVTSARLRITAIGRLPRWDSRSARNSTSARADAVAPDAVRVAGAGVDVRLPFAAIHTIDGQLGDARLRQVTRSLSHFVPQLALPKRFDTERADRLLAMTAPPVRAYWPHMLDDLLRVRWSSAATADGDVADERGRVVA